MLGEPGPELSFSNVNKFETYSNRHLSIPSVCVGFEPLKMFHFINVLGSTKVQLLSLLYKPFDRYIDSWHTVFFSVNFDGINFSKKFT